MVDVQRLKQSLATAKTIDEVTAIELSILGKHGAINTYAKEVRSLDAEGRKSFGQTLNKLKVEVTTLIAARTQELAAEAAQTLVITDPSIPGIAQDAPNLHPTTLVIRHIMGYFTRLGYSVYEGPEIETDEYNFDKLNLPPDHPARDLQDTLYISEPEYLLRTHTSSVETRCMTAESLPIRILAPGKCYRNESTNASNNAIFYQLEGLFVDKGIHMGHLKATLEGFAKHLYGADVKTRFRCKYYPQVEPGAGMDIACQICGAVGCAVCKYRGWIEALGAGMVHPEALRKCGIDPTVYSGFAFGMGLDRLVMMKYGITDIRKLYSGELVWKG